MGTSSAALTSKKVSPLATQTIHLVLSIYFIFALSATVVQFYFEYLNEEDVLLNELETLTLNYEKLLSTAIWTMDDTQVENAMASIVKNNLVRGIIVVIEVDNRQFTQGEIPPQFDLSTALTNTTKEGKFEKYNRKFIKMWNIPKNIVESGDDAQALEYVLELAQNGAGTQNKHLRNGFNVQSGKIVHDEVARALA